MEQDDNRAMALTKRYSERFRETMNLQGLRYEQQNIDTCMHAHTYTHLSKFWRMKLEVSVPRPEMLNVIQIFFLKGQHMP